jgi:hypothetical protein
VAVLVDDGVDVEDRGVRREADHPALRRGEGGGEQEHALHPLGVQAGVHRAEGAADAVPEQRDRPAAGGLADVLDAAADPPLDAVVQGRLPIALHRAVPLDHPDVQPPVEQVLHEAAALAEVQDVALVDQRVDDQHRRAIRRRVGRRVVAEELEAALAPGAGARRRRHGHPLGVGVVLGPQAGLDGQRLQEAADHRPLPLVGGAAVDRGPRVGEGAEVDGERALGEHVQVAEVLGPGRLPEAAQAGGIRGRAGPLRHERRDLAAHAVGPGLGPRAGLPERLGGPRPGQLVGRPFHPAGDPAGPGLTDLLGRGGGISSRRGEGGAPERLRGPHAAAGGVGPEVEQLAGGVVGFAHGSAPWVAHGAASSVRRRLSILPVGPVGRASSTDTRRGTL